MLLIESQEPTLLSSRTGCASGARVNCLVSAFPPLDLERKKRRGRRRRGRRKKRRRVRSKSKRVVHTLR